MKTAPIALPLFPANWRVLLFSSLLVYTTCYAYSRFDQRIDRVHWSNRGKTGSEIWDLWESKKKINRSIFLRSKKKIESKKLFFLKFLSQRLCIAQEEPSLPLRSRINGNIKEAQGGEKWKVWKINNKVLSSGRRRGGPPSARRWGRKEDGTPMVGGGRGRSEICPWSVERREKNGGWWKKGEPLGWLRSRGLFNRFKKSPIIPSREAVCSPRGVRYVTTGVEQARSPRECQRECHFSF